MTLYDILRHLATLYDIVQHLATLYDILWQFPSLSSLDIKHHKAS